VLTVTEASPEAARQVLQLGAAASVALRALWLSACSLVECGGASVLAATLAAVPQLAHLGLVWTPLGDSGTRLVATGLPSQLQSLQVDWSDPSSDSVQALAATVGDRSTVEHLSVRGTGALGDDAAAVGSGRCCP
jgi:hypothetical protein